MKLTLGEICHISDINIVQYVVASLDIMLRDKRGHIHKCELNGLNRKSQDYIYVKGEYHGTIEKKNEALFET